MCGRKTGALAPNCHSRDPPAFSGPHPVQILAADLVIERGGRTVIDGLSFSVGAGEALLLTGANGSGKTSLLRTLAGFLRPVSGSVAVQGGGADATLAEHCHVVGHTNAVKTPLTVRENIAFWAGYLDKSDGHEQRVETALRQFRLENLADFPASDLSAGQKRRLGLARLLSAHRAIWLLDEPTASLDTASARLLAQAANAHTAGGGIVIAATHLPLGLDRARELRLDRQGPAS